MKRLLPILLAVGCSASPRLDESAATQEPPTPFEEDWQSYRDTHALPSSMASSGQLGSLLSAKVEAQKGLMQRYEDLLRSDELPAQAQANFGKGRLFLNMGCELLTMDAPVVGKGADVQAAYRSAMLERVKPLLDKAKGFFAASAEMRVGSASSFSAGLVSAMTNTSPVDACIATASTWEPTARPEPQPVTQAECIERTKKAFYIADDCFDHIDAACRGGQTEHCATLAEQLYRDGETERASELWMVACDAGRKGSCVSLSLIPRAEQRDADVASCAKDDVLACYRLARLTDRQNAALTCSTEDVLPKPSKSSQKACAGGDAGECWARVASVVDKSGFADIQVAGVLGSLVGGLGMAGTGKKADPRAECERGRAHFCIQYARTLEGAEQIPWLERACSLDANVGCQMLGEVLVSSGADVKRGTDLVVNHCVENGVGCSGVAKRFFDGDKVPKSKTCAAALSLQRCSPDNRFSCMSVDRIFHPKEDETK